MTPREPVLVVGAGIGGLTLGAALARAGIPFRIFERAPALSEVGAGLGLWSSGVRALRGLDLGAHLFARSIPIEAGELTTSSGRVLARFSLAALAERAGAPCFVLDRRELHRAIAEGVPSASLTLGANVTRVDEAAGGVTVSVEGLGDVRGSLVVGADGLRSVVRDKVVGAGPLRYGGETCFRGIARIAPREKTVLRESQGQGVRSAVCALDDERVYWWATLPLREGKRVPVDERRVRLLDAFDGFHTQICEAIRATPSEDILQHDLLDRPPTRTWSSSCITLLGDAAHPTTPNLGQGAGMAIEDAIVLARALVTHERLVDALAAYERARVARTARIVRQSRVVGLVGQWRHPLAVRARESSMRLVPSALLERELAWQILYDAHTVDVSS